MTTTIKSPFNNESETISIGGLTIENRTDRVSIYGDIDITMDIQGLEQAETLLAVLNKVVFTLKSGYDSLPDKANEASIIDVVVNPFAIR